MEDYTDDEAIAASISNTDEFTFPTPHIHRSLENISIQDTMRPQPPSRTPSEAASSYLDDSVYDIVSVGEASEGGLLSDDEDARTESLASVDGRETPDNVDVYSTDDEDEEREFGYNSLADAVSPQQSRRSTLVDIYPSVDDSGYSARTARPEYSASQTIPHLVFGKDPSDRHVLGEDKLMHVFQSTEEESMMSELSVYGSSHVGLSMHLTASKVIPSRKGPFRLLVAAYNEHLVHDAALHIQQALDRVGIVKSDVELIVERCRAAYTGKDRRTIHLDIEGCDGLQTAPGGLVGRSGKHPTPDLALFLHPSLAHVPAESVEQMEETFARMRDAMLRCKVPIMDLSEYHPLFQAQPMSYLCSKKSLYLQVEIGQKNDKAVIEHLPVDLDKFLAIDPKTLGRHLACILPKIDPRGDAHVSWYRIFSRKAQESRRASQAAVSKWTAPVIRKIRNLDFKWASVLFLLFTISITLLTQGLSPTYKVEMEDSLQQFSSNLTTSASVVKIVTPASSASPAPPHALSTMLDERIKTIDLIDERIKFWTQPDPVPKLSNMYQANAHGDNLIVLTPVAEFPTASKSQVQLSVTRDAQLLKSQVSRLANGAYVVELEREQAHGVLSIMINCRVQKARHYQGLTVDLGSPWLKASTWNRAADAVVQVVHEDLAAAQNSAQEISVRMTTSLQNYVKGFSNFGQKTAHLVDDTRKSFLQISAETALAPWKAFQQLRQSPELKEVSTHISQQSNNAVQQIGASVKAAQSKAGDVLRDMDLRKMMPENLNVLPMRALARGQRNAQDLISKLRGEKAAAKKCGCGLKRAKPLLDHSMGGMFGRGKPAPKCGKK